MKKILILGCSFTEGTSKACDVVINGVIDEPYNNFGWWCYSDYFKEHDVTVISMPSQGYFSYYQTVLFLEEIDKLVYDEIWIQETSEPRATLNHWRKMLNIINDAKIIKFNDFEFLHYGIPARTTVHLYQPDQQRYTDHKYDHTKTHGIPWIHFFNRMVSQCTDSIQSLCESKNITGYIWSMHNEIMKCKNFHRLPNMKNIHALLKKENLLTCLQPHAHQTEDGNRYIGKLIDDSL